MCYGAETENLFLVETGGFIAELAPLAYALGLGFGDKMVTVTRWGNPGKGAGYVMGGKKTYLNYLLSGKWQRGFTNQYAAYSTGHSWKVMAKELSFPKGFKWVFGFFGIVIGVIGLIQAFQGAGWGAGILGILSILFGLLLLTNAFIASLTLPFIFGILAIVGGLAALVMAFRMR